MKRRKHLTWIVGCALLFSSCSKNEEEVAPAEAAGKSTTVAAKKMPSKPFKGSMTFVPSTNYNLPCNCPPTAPAYGTLVGTGNITHLGLATSYIMPCASPTTTGLDVAMECAKFVAANGDQIYTYTYPYQMVFTPTGATGNIVVDFTGGTGKFTAASGSFTATVTLTSNGVAVMSNIDGTISY